MYKISPKYILTQNINDFHLPFPYNIIDRETERERETETDDPMFHINFTGVYIHNII